MSARTRLLVTGVGSNIGQGIVKALRLGCPDAYVVGIDANPSASGFFACDAAYVVPRASEEGYRDALELIVQAEGVALVLPGSHFELATLARIRAEFVGATGSDVLISTADVIDACVDKWVTYQWLRDRGHRYPETLLMEMASPSEVDAFVAKVGFPLVVKPRLGQGSNHVHVVADEEALRGISKATPQALVQEHLGSADQEFTVALVGDEAGRVHAWTAMRRSLAAGTTVIADTGRHEEVEAEACRIVESFGLRGPSNVQLRITARGPVAFEINPRFSGTTAMRALAGWNDVAACVRTFVHREPLTLAAPRVGRLMRVYDEVFIPAAELEAVARDRYWRPSRTSAIASLSLYGRHDQPRSSQNVAALDQVTPAAPLLLAAQACKVVVFDCGGTLIEHAPSPTDVFCGIAEAVLGRPADRERVAEAYRMVDFAHRQSAVAMKKSGGDKTAFYEEHNRQLAAVLGLSSYLERLSPALRAAFRERRRWMAFPDAVPTLQALRRSGIALFVVANWDDNLSQVLSDCGLGSYFLGVQASATLGVEKPNPKVFDRLLSTLSVSPERCLYVGDDYALDVLAARGAGLVPALIDRSDRYRDADCLRLSSLAALAELAGSAA